MLLSHKYICCDTVNGPIVLHKANSRSIGEHIATATSSIYMWHYLDRHLLTYVAEDFYMHLYKGYIDDTFGVCLASQSAIDKFQEFASGLEGTCELKFEASRSTVADLDLQIYCSRECHFATDLYREPTVNPQLLVPWPHHRVANIIIENIIMENIIIELQT